MKQNVKLIEDHERSAWGLTMENLNKLNLTVQDIAGLFFEQNDEYKRMVSDLTDATKHHSELITHICLAKDFHNRMSIFPDEQLDLIVRLASDLPFSLQVASKLHSQIPLHVLKKNFELLYSKKLFWKATSVQMKFYLWKFAHTINRVYNDLYILNLEKIISSLAIHEDEQNEFDRMHAEHLSYLIRAQKENEEIHRGIFLAAGTHCTCC